MKLTNALRGQYDARTLEHLQLVLEGLQWTKQDNPQQDVGIDPIEELPFPVPPAGYDTDGTVSSWVIDHLGTDAFIDQHWERLLASKIRVVFVIHDTAGQYNTGTGLENYQVREWNGDNTGTGQPDDHNHSHNVATCIAGNKPGTRLGILRRLAEAGKVVIVADKVLSKGSGSFSWIRSGYNRAVDLPYQENDLVIHVSSFGALGAYDAGTAEAVRRGIAKGQIWTASSGNSGHDPAGNSRVGFPASLEEVIAVGAVDPANQRKSYSSTGPEVYSTNGSGVPCVNRDGSISNREGTSFSQPINAAVLGLIALYNDTKLTQEQAKFIIRTQSLDLGDQGRDTFFGFGIQTSDTIQPPQDGPGDDPGENPGGDPPTPPQPPKVQPYVLRLQLDHYAVSWKYLNEMDGPLREISFTEVQINVAADQPAQDLSQKLIAIIDDYSRRSYLGVPEGWREEEVAAIAFRFLDMYLTEQHGIIIDPVVASVRVQDENGNFTANSYRLADVGRWKDTPEDNQSHGPRNDRGTGFSLSLKPFIAMSQAVNQYGIKETTELFDAGLALRDAIKLSKADDGKVTFPGDLVNFVAPIPRIIAGVEGANLVPRELTDLNEEELTALEAKFGQIVHDERYLRIFRGLAMAGDAIIEIIQEEKEQAAA